MPGVTISFELDPPIRIETEQGTRYMRSNHMSVRVEGPPALIDPFAQAVHAVAIGMELARDLPARVKECPL